MTVGYDNLAINEQIVLDLPFREATGTVIHDRSKNHAEFAYVGGPPDLWVQLASGIWVIEFTPQPNARWLQSSISNLWFGASDFSIAMWLNFDVIDQTYLLLYYGHSGYSLMTIDTNRFAFATYQGAANQVTYTTAEVTVDEWMLVSVSRSGTLAQIYKNGNQIDTGSATHLDPTGAGAATFYISDGGLSALDGKMGRPRLWEDRAFTRAEWRALYESERSLYGV